MTGTDYGIRAVGAYTPDLRISADEFVEAWGNFASTGIETKSVPDADEDSLTMAVEASRCALNAAETDGQSIDFLAFATTTPPLEEGDLTPHLRSALNIPEGATCHSFSGSTRAGASALAACLDSSPSTGLVVASDCPQGEPGGAIEHAAGAGAAAFVVGDNAPVTVVDRATSTQPYPGTRFRRQGDNSTDSIDVTSYSRDAFSETLASAADEVAVGDIDAAAVQAPDGAMPYRVTGVLDIEREHIAACETVSELGDTAAASVPLSLAKAFDDGHQRVLAAAFGSGAGADVFVFDVNGKVPTVLTLDGQHELPYPDYLRRRGELTSGLPEGGGAYVSVPTWHRSIPHRYRLVAGRCPQCSTLNYPPEGACIDCRNRATFEMVELPGTGTVEVVTGISPGGAPPEFSELQAQSGNYLVATVALDGPDANESVSLPIQAVPTLERLSPGDRVRTTFRRIYTQEGVTRYGFKIRAEDEK